MTAKWLRSGADAERIKQIAETIQDLDLTQFPAWHDLKMLSHNTIIDGIEVDPAGIRLDDDEFDGIMTVYVALTYGKGKGELTTSDAFPGQFHGHFADGGPKVTEATVDMSAFFSDTEPAREGSFGKA